MSACRREVLQLYKSLLREGMKFSSYNFRMYAVRRVKDAFRENYNKTDTKEIGSLISLGRENLVMMKRQVIIGDLYKTNQLVIEQHGP